MVLEGNGPDKLYSIYGTNVQEITIPNIVNGWKITFISGGGDTVIGGGGYIVFRNGTNVQQKLFKLSTNNSQITTFSEISIEFLSVGIVVSMSGGGGSDPTGILFFNTGESAIISPSMSIVTYRNAGFHKANYGGYANFEYMLPSGYAISANGKLWYDNCNVEIYGEADITPNLLASGYVNNKHNINYGMPAAYYTIGNGVYFFCIYDDINNQQQINQQILSALQKTPLYLSGGGKFENTGSNDPFGYIAYTDDTLYYLMGRSGYNQITNFTGQIQALTGMGNNDTQNTSFGAGFLITSTNTPCLHPDTQVSVYENGSIITKKISLVRSNDYVIKFDGTPIRVVNNVKLAENSNFVEIPAHTFSNNVPNNDIYITDYHPIFLDGVEVVPSKIANIYQNIKHCKLEFPVAVYTLITEERTSILMNGLNVYTWNKEDFDKKKYNCILL